jgi:two-component system OmpR family response regulator
MRLLVIEDDEVIGSFVEKGLRQAGYVVDRVLDAESGLDLMEVNKYDLLILDLMLPGIDGLTLIEKVRETGDATPVLILSARKSIDDRVKGLQKGGDDYLTKPFSFSEMIARVQALLRRSGMKQKGSTELKVADLTNNFPIFNTICA